jgi:hypothetical protein
VFPSNSGIAYENNHYSVLNNSGLPHISGARCGGGRRIAATQRAEAASTNNYFLELKVQRGEKAATYLIAFNGGQISLRLTKGS